jgi:hypothetical protein
MVTIPDSLKPIVAALAKYHFWILATLVPLLLLPAIFSANGILRAAIGSQRSAIDGHLSALRSVKGEADHPNDRWVEAIDAQTGALRAGILEEWTGFWESQRPLRTWPQELGDDFVSEINAVEAGRKTAIRDVLLQRYQNKVRELVRQLPDRMGCKELMGDALGVGGDLRPGAGIGPDANRVGAEDDVDSPEASLTLDPLIWRAEDQQKLFKSFVWQRVPSLTQVRLAQEELWVYGLLCDVIKNLNQGAKGSFDASVTAVEELAVGYPAAEEAPGGFGGARIVWLEDTQTASQPDESMLDGMPLMDEGREGTSQPWKVRTRPENPRFSESGGGPDQSMAGRRRPPASRATGGFEGEEDGAAAITPDQALRQWIYVDFEGRPLAGPAIETSADATMTHLVPFTLRLVIDQRKIDRLLKQLAGNAVPIDVRQVRINPRSQFAGGGSVLPAAVASDAGGAEALGGDRRRRPYDVALELRGTVALATPPNPRALGAGTSPDRGDQP